MSSSWSLQDAVVDGRRYVVPYYWDPDTLAFVVATTGGSGIGAEVKVTNTVPVSQSGAPWSIAFYAPQHIICDSGSISFAPGSTVTANIGTTGGLALEAGGHLASIDGKDFATQATLALVKAKTDNLDVLLSTRLKPADTLAGVTTVDTVTAITNALPTGANVIGKTGIDQTTPGTTNKVYIGNDGSVTLLAGAAVIGHVIIDSGTITTITNAVAVTNANLDSPLSGIKGDTAHLDVNLSTRALEAGGNLATLAGKDFATSAKQDTGNVSAASVDSKMGTVEARPAAYSELDRLYQLGVKLDKLSLSVATEATLKRIAGAAPLAKSTSTLLHRS